MPTVSSLKALKVSSVFNPTSCAVGKAVEFITETPQRTQSACLVTKYDESVLELLQFENGATRKLVVKLSDVLSNAYSVVPLVNLDTIDPETGKEIEPTL